MIIYLSLKLVRNELIKVEKYKLVYKWKATISTLKWPLLGIASRWFI